MHQAIQDFSNYQDDERVIDQVVKFNSQFYKLNLDIHETISMPVTVGEGDRVESVRTHTPHIKNYYSIH